MGVCGKKCTNFTNSKQDPKKDEQFDRTMRVQA